MCNKRVDASWPGGTPCSHCKKPFQEIDLTWVRTKDKLRLLCKECYKIFFK